MDEINNNLRKVPSNIEAEKAVLGGIFLKPELFADVYENLKPEDFYRNSYRVIFESMLSLYSDSQTIDPLLVIELLRKNSKYEEVGGDKTLYEIIEDTPTSANVVSYAKIVREKSILRKLTEVGSKIVELASEGTEDVQKILDKAEGLIFKISETKESKDIVGIKEAIENTFERLQRVYENKGEIIGITSGFKNYDKVTSGFQASNLVIIAARPAMGKTAFALNVALNAALKAKKSILIFSLEMGNMELLDRLYAVESGVSISKIKNGFMTDAEWGKLGLASGVLANAEINIADVPNVNVLEIRAIARRLKAANKLDMVIVDYLQLIGGNGRAESRQNEVSEISRALKGIARELDIPVIALSQLSRAPESRGAHEKRPVLSDLRESGAIEQDADIV
ncbi:MAG: replicative DNA helicase, partial [Fusobacteriaceae bacterium]